MKHWISSAALLFASACAQVAPPALELVRFEVTTSHAAPVAGARVLVNGEVIGETDTGGTVEARLVGGELGHAVELRCPPHHEPEQLDRRVVLQRTYGLDRTPITAPIRLQCEPTRLAAAIVVRTVPAADIPVLVEGEVVGTTGQDGVLHYLTHVERHSTLRVDLDASALPELRPASVGRSFSMTDRDAVLTLDGQFELSKPKKRPLRRASPRAMPYRID